MDSKNLEINPFNLSFKQFLEVAREKSGLSQEEFLKNKIMLPITDLKTYNILKNSKNLSFILEKRTNEELKDQTYLKELNKIDPNLVQVETELNEYYAKTNIIQYYVNKLDVPIELILKFPNNSKVQFSKFTLEMNNKTVISKVIEKEKAKEKYSDAIASGNVGALSSEKDNFIKVNIGNIPSKSIAKLTSEFIQFINTEDMSYCYTCMKNFPNFSDQKGKFQKIQIKINIKTFSKITRLITKGFNQQINKKFNENYTQCLVFYCSLNQNIKKELENEEFKILFRTESMNKFNLITQYDKNKDETSCILSMVYNQKDIIIPINKIPDLDSKNNYINLYQKNIINNNPSLFIFLIDQSGSMSHQKQMVKESLILFLQSLPKGSYYHIIEFGTIFRYIYSEFPVEYTRENVNKTISVIQNLEADLGGTCLFKPLEKIFKGTIYENINLCKYLFILTDGYVEDKKECLSLIEKNSKEFRIHTFGLGYYFDREFIEKAGKNGSSNYINEIPKLKMSVIQTLNKTLRSYLYDANITIENLDKIYEYKNYDKICFQDDSLSYYFIIKNKISDNIKVKLKYYEKSELIQKDYNFDSDNIFFEKEGDIISKIIIGNILKNELVDINKNIKLAKKYQVSSKYTSLFAHIENNNPNITLSNLKLIGQNEEKNIINQANKQKSLDNKKYNDSTITKLKKENLLLKKKNEKIIKKIKKLNGICFRFLNRFDRDSSSDSRSDNISDNRSDTSSDSSSEYYRKRNKRKKRKKDRKNYNISESESDDEEEDKRKTKKKKLKERKKCKKNEEEEEEKKSKKKSKKKVSEDSDSDYKSGPRKSKIKKENSDEEEKISEACEIEYDEKKESNERIKEKIERKNDPFIDEKCESIGLINKKEDESYEKYEDTSYNKFNQEKNENNKLDEEEKFDFKKMVLTQDILEGNWFLNHQTKLLINQNQKIYDKIKNYVEKYDIQNKKEEIIITILVIYCLKHNTEIEQLEYTLIINKGLSFLESIGIKEILYGNIESVLNY